MASISRAAADSPHSSAPGTGTPAALAGIFHRSAAEIPPPRVLVIEDEALLRWSLVETLADAGYGVVQAQNGREARTAWTDPAHPVALVLLDLKLPDAHGLELLEEARRRCVTCPIIVMTAYGTAETVESALQHGAMKVLSKPFDLQSLLRLVRHLCPLPAA